MSKTALILDSAAQPLADKRIYVYVDGYNLYSGMKDAGLNKLYWLNLWLLGKSFEKPASPGKAGSSLKHVRYFTTYSSGGRSWHNTVQREDREQSRLRQFSYIEALKTLPETDFSIFEGTFRDEERDCPLCKKTYNRVTEKMTDVRLATQILLDGFDDLFDIAIIVSADADQVPAIQICKTKWPNKSILVAFPPERSSDDLRRNAHSVFHINTTMLRAGQFPEQVHRYGKKSLIRPKEWS